MQKYFIWQGKTPEIFFDSGDTIRRLWLEASEYYLGGPVGANHVRTGFVSKFSPIKNHFAPKASVMADTLAEVFDLGNGMGDASKLVQILPMHSVSVGDFIEESDGECHLVMPMGFLRLGRVTLEVPEVYYA